MDGNHTTDGKVFVCPYQSSSYTTGTIQGVWLAPDEEVEWMWTYGLDNLAYVSGYTIKKKLNLEGK